MLVLTNYDTDADILGAIEAGASGYLLKDAPPSELVAAVRAAAVGDSALAPTVSSRLTASREAGDRLTAREAEVLTLVAEGRSNRDIGRALSGETRRSNPSCLRLGDGKRATNSPATSATRR